MARWPAASTSSRRARAVGRVAVCSQLHHQTLQGAGVCLAIPRRHHQVVARADCSAALLLAVDRIPSTPPQPAEARVCLETWAQAEATPIPSAAATKLRVSTSAAETRVSQLLHPPRLHQAMRHRPPRRACSAATRAPQVAALAQTHQQPRVALHGILEA